MPELTRRLFLTSPAALAFAQQPASVMPDRRVLAGAYSTEKLAPLLLPLSAWTPYPRSANRAAWEALPAELRRAVVSAAEKRLGTPWPSVPASVMLDFKRNGNRSRLEALSFGRRNRLRQAVIAECIENKGRFLDDILDGLWLICEETFWGVSAHLGAQKAGTGLPDVSEPIVDLFAAETGNTIAWIDYLIPSQLDSLSPLLRPRLRLEVRRRILEPCRTRINFGWMGLNPGRRERVNNWNPWINSNWLACELLLEEDPSRRAASVYKIMTSVDRFLDSYDADGGCDEGPGYWGRAGASLFDCLELLYSASGGKIDFYSVPLVKEIGAYIYRAHIAGDWYTNFADASARVTPNGNLVWRYGRRTGDAKMAAHGAWIASTREKPRTEPDAMGRYLDELFHLDELRKAGDGARPPLERDVFLPGTQVFAARLQQGSDRGFYLAAQGGHNAESHNHNDVGNFIVFHDGEPVLIDVGVETYTAKTFSSQRYEIWTMQSAWHNCPTINGVTQSAGRRFEASGFTSRSDGAGAEVSIGLERAYPAEAGVKSWRRTIRLDRAANAVSVRDKFQLSKRQSLEFSLITTREPRETAPGEITLAGGFKLAYDKSLKAVIDEHSSEDARLRPIWGPVVRRIRLTASEPPAEGEYVVLVSR